MRSALIIGAGIGGLATAARLAREGYRVTVVERADRPGGRASKIEEQGFRFDTGPTLFLMPQVFAETYQALGERMEDHLDLVRLDPTYRVHFHDGSTLDLTSQLPIMRDQLEAMEPGSFEAFMRFLAEGYRHYHLSLDRFVGRNFPTLLSYFSLQNLPLLFKVKALTRHAANTARYFRDPRLRAAFSFQNMYLGLSPYDAPATYSLLQYSELAEGVWFPRGGVYEVIQSLEGIARGLGVSLNYNCSVARIDVDGNRATGVTLEHGDHLAADVVIANADLPYVYSRLLPPSDTTRRLETSKYTSSALMFYWGVRIDAAAKDRKSASAQLLHHNVFLADHRYRESFERIFRDHALPDEPSFYVCAPTRTDPSFAPEGSDNLMVLVPVGHLDESRPQDWDALRHRARQVVLERLGRLDPSLQGVEKRIEFEAVMNPLNYLHDLNLAKGSAFGLSHNFMQVGYLRPHNRHEDYHNLYFVGASTHPGTGLPIVLISARLVVERLLAEQGEARSKPYLTRGGVRTQVRGEP